PVTMISETFIASPAFMEISALNRALKEGKNTSGAHIMLDDALSDDFYLAIKATPSIAQVAVKEAMLKAFNDTMSENINIMNFFNTIFAVVIAVGVVYNAGRISLSERSRELASLRVLGFTRGEASYILLGELGILLLLALPIGSLFGYGLAWFWALSLDTDLYRVPLVISSATFGYSILVVVLAGVATAIGTHYQIINLNLIEALKTRE
ncbi:MAG: ABC transporter permease, partial [Rhodospirillaceae bacterium]|nr:ABC transporter permease [Rhodospirillaceae bacterium]